MNLAPELLEILACPTTGKGLSLHSGHLHSPEDTTYPIINGVPWLLPNPQNSLADWGVKLNHFNQVLLAEIQSLEKSLERAEGATAQRLELLLLGKQAFLRRVSELLFPVVVAKAASKAVYEALNDRAPNTQNLLSYEANLYRDWVWGEEENAMTAEAVASLIDGPKPKRLAVLGAGAGRLALDLHELSGTGMTVATDINPLLLMAAQHLTSGQDLELFEFPLHPRSIDCVAVKHHIQGQPKPDNFHFVFSDVGQPCFQPGSFDVVVTPWLIDIQPLALSAFLRQLNQYLPIGGRWLNFGSLVFNQKRDALCYSVEEVRELATAQGFDITAIEEKHIPYLKSPYNAGYRQEHVWLWSATKKQDVEPSKKTQNLPAWLLDDSQAIPKAGYFPQFIMTHRTYAQLAAEVDGRTSIQKIVKKFSRQHKMDETEAHQLISQFFMDIHNNHLRS